MKNFNIKKANSKILSNMVGCTFYVYKGDFFIPIKIYSNMIGFYFGEFVKTRKLHVYKKK